MQTAPPAVRLINVTKRIGKKTILHGLDFSVERGEVFGLLGPNGAGKTTTIRLIVGLIALTGGDILIHGRSVKTSFIEAISQVGAVVETPEMYGFLTGRQNLAHFANLSRRIVGQDRLEEVESLLGMRDYIHDRVATYSLGMRQRLGIAQALLHRPSVLILDEPTNGLDPAGIKELREHLRSLAGHDGVAVIVSSHILAEMELMCDRAAVIKGGRLIDLHDLRRNEDQLVCFTVDDPGRALRLVAANFPGLAAACEGDALAAAADRETAARINACLSGAGIMIYAMQPRVRTLEEIFISLTGDDEHV